MENFNEDKTSLKRAAELDGSNVVEHIVEAGKNKEITDETALVKAMKNSNLAEKALSEIENKGKCCECNCR